LLWLGIWSAVASAAEKLANLEDPHQYEKACPDYKRYSTFAQYVPQHMLVASANFSSADLSQKGQWLCLSSDPRFIAGLLALPW
jgi:hypothetical protein